MRPSALAVLALAATPALAHDGPPYPIFVDEAVGPFVVTVFTDPDVGTGTFYVYVEAPEGRDPLELGVRVESTFAGSSKGSPILTARGKPVPEAELAEAAEESLPPTAGEGVEADPGQDYQWLVELEYARRGVWPTTLSFTAPGIERTLSYSLDVTPPGLGKIDFVIYLFPFVIIAFFWLKILARQRAYDREQDALEAAEEERGEGVGTASPD